MASLPSTRWKAALAWFGLIVFCLALPVALLTGWARLVANDPEGYTRTARAMAADPRVQFGLQNAVARRAEELLGGDNPTATQAVQSRVLGQALGKSAGEVVAGNEFPEVWEEANREAYRALFAGQPEDWGEPVILDLSPLTGELQAEIDALDVDLPGEMRLNPDDLRIEVINPANADQIRAAVQQLDLLFWPASAVAIVALILALALAPDRLAMAGRIAFGVTIAMVALIAVLVVAQGTARAGAPSGGGVALGAIIDAASQELRLAAIGLALGGLVLAGIVAALCALRRGTVRRLATG